MLWRDRLYRSSPVKLLSKNNLVIGGESELSCYNILTEMSTIQQSVMIHPKKQNVTILRGKNTVSTNCLSVTKIVGFSTQCNHASHLRKGC